MVKVVTSLAAGCEPDINHVVRSWDKADHSRHEKYGALKPILRFGNGESAHTEQSHPNKEQHDGCTYCFPVFSDFWMVPTVHGLCCFDIFVDQRIGISGCGVFCAFVGFAVTKKYF